MDLSKLKSHLMQAVTKYKFVLLILCIGVALILIPVGRSEDSTASIIINKDTSSYISEDALASILTKIKGAGKVEVLLSVEYSAQKDYQINTDGSTAGIRSTTVTVTDAQRNETGLINRTQSPIYRGAIIVCEGADNPSVHLCVVRAISNITGLRSDQISVLKMK